MLRKEENAVSEMKDKEEAERENSAQSLHPEVIEAATGAEEPCVISDKEVGVVGEPPVMGEEELGGD